MKEVNLDEQITALREMQARIQGQIDLLVQLKNSGAVLTVPEEKPAGGS